MFLQILMLTRQNKCHAAYFFNPCVLPNGFPCSEALTQCCIDQKRKHCPLEEEKWKLIPDFSWIPLYEIILYLC